MLSTAFKWCFDCVMGRVARSIFGVWTKTNKKNVQQMIARWIKHSCVLGTNNAAAM